MTREDIIRMAQGANILEPMGFDKPNMAQWRDDIVRELEAFAALVAAAEREEFAVHAIDIARRAIAEEREACAKVCEELLAPDIYSDTDKSMWDVTCMDCAAAIRARGQA